MKRLRSLMIMSLFAGSAQAADLMQVYRDALEFDAQYASVRAQSAADREKKPQGLAGLLPQVGASADSKYNDIRFTEPLSGSGRYNSNSWGVQLTQPIFRLQNWEQYKQGELAAAIAELQTASAQQDLMLRAANAYFN